MLLWLLHADQALFHTGWFVESVISAALVVFVLRTRLPALKSRPSCLMASLTAGVVLVTLVLPYLPIAGLLGFKPLPPHYLLIIGVIVVMYLATAELTKRWFYRTYASQ